MATEHAWKRNYGFWIWCRCGWAHFSWSDTINERALGKHIEMHRA